MRQPQYRRTTVAPQVVRGDRSVEMFGASDGEDALRDAAAWTLNFLLDWRRCVGVSHLHKCQKTCFKTRPGQGGGSGPRLLCRFNYIHFHKAFVKGPRGGVNLVIKGRSGKGLVRQPRVLRDDVGGRAGRVALARMHVAEGAALRKGCREEIDAGA